MHKSWPLAHCSRFVDILKSLIQAGWDLSTSLILVARQGNILPLHPCRERDVGRIELNIFRPGYPGLGVHIEVKTTLVVELLVRRFISHKMVDPGSTKQLW